MWKAASVMTSTVRDMALRCPIRMPPPRPRPPARSASTKAKKEGVKKEGAKKGSGPVTVNLASTFVVQGDFHVGVKDACKSMGGTWCSGMTAWVFPESKRDEVSSGELLSISRLAHFAGYGSTQGHRRS